MSYRLIKKIEERISFCQKKIMEPEAFKKENEIACALWIEEKNAYQHVLLDLYKLRDGRNIDTNYEKSGEEQLESYYE